MSSLGKQQLWVEECANDTFRISTTGIGIKHAAQRFEVDAPYVVATEFHPLTKEQLAEWFSRHVSRGCKFVEIRE